MADLTCTGALGLSTRILCSDFIWRPVRDLHAGDSIVAFDQSPAGRGKHRKFRIAQVMDCRKVERPCYRVRFADGREVVASPERMWLSARSGRGPRVMACELCELPFRNWQGLSSHRRHLHGLPGIWQAHGYGTWITTDFLRPGTTIKDLGASWDADNSREAGYLGGVFDGEASFQIAASHGAFCIMFAQKPGHVLDYTRQILKDKGFREYDGTYSELSGVVHLPVRGAYDCFRFLGQCRPVRLLAKSDGWLDDLSPFNRHGAGSVAVASVEHLGDQEMVELLTTTKTLFAEGLFGSHPE